MKGVLYVAGEGLPYIKSGGLADVIGSLPPSLDSEKYKVAVVMPMYKKIFSRYEMEKVCDLDVKSGIIRKKAEVYHDVSKGIDFYFIKEDSYFDRDEMYGYADDGERFAYFCKAVCVLVGKLPFRVNIIHNHDWHTGLVPVICKTEYKDFRKNIKQVFTIHNLLFQGNFPLELLNCTNLKQDLYDDGSIRFDNGISFMKAALTFSDKITTVSQTYAQEILTPEYGERMEGILETRKDDLVGIVNGIDVDSWNPETDENIGCHYSARSLANKKKCKKQLQAELGLRVADDVMLVGMVSRLTWQKGASIIIEKLSTIMGQDIQLIILGSGDSYIESQFRRIEYDYPHRAVFYCGYNEALSHRVYAGCDLFLMPSLFEPCGISQLISMRYGTLPLVREVGGLKDTVTPYNEFDKTGTGFSFKNFTGDDLVYILKFAIEVYYYRKDDWKKLQKSAMNLDVSWNNSAEKYDELYSSL